MNITIIHGQRHKETSYHIGRTLVDKLKAKDDIAEFFCHEICRSFVVVAVSVFKMA